VALSTPVSAQAVGEIDIWRAANQLIRRYPDDPVLEGALRADLALGQGDMFNFHLWQRVAKAVAELQQGTPGDGEAVN
jgi:hypothetical protein